MILKKTSAMKESDQQTNTMSLQSLLAIEDHAELLDFRCATTGLLWWPQIRTVFIRMAMSDHLYETQLDGSVSRGIRANRMFSTMFRSVMHNGIMQIQRRNVSNICIMSSGIGHQLIDGTQLNRLSDHFANFLHEQSITIEDHFEWRWISPRKNDRVLLHAPLQAINAIDARLRTRNIHRQAARSLITLVSERAEKLLQWRPGSKREDALVQLLSGKIASMAQHVGRYEKVLSRIRPTLLMTLTGSYGPASTLILAAKNLGIVTAEYQHGVLSRGHDGYNFAPTLINCNAFQKGLPEHFLSYGTWWSDQVNVPVRMTPIGNPVRDFRISRLNKVSATKNILLILGDGTECELYLALAKTLEASATKMGLIVVFRPHPLERSKIKTKYGRQLGQIVIDQNDDLYTTLSNAHVVVSELSTGLFEAVGLADKIFVWNTLKSRFGFPVFPFKSFDSAQDLMQQIEADNCGRLSHGSVEAIWTSGWKTRYQSFVDSISHQK